MSEILIMLGFVVGLLSTFRWVYHSVTGDTMGWWDASTYLFFGGLIKRACGWVFSFFDAPQLITQGTPPALWLLIFYVMLRQWHDVPPKQAGFILGSWSLILILTIVLFIATNQQLFSSS
tara:strand:- start:35319 stop:35678 length:360 start_codon:yes stop_codon:yes gene_type:complete